MPPKLLLYHLHSTATEVDESPPLLLRSFRDTTRHGYHCLNQPANCRHRNQGPRNQHAVSRIVVNPNPAPSLTIISLPSLLRTIVQSAPRLYSPVGPSSYTILIALKPITSAMIWTTFPASPSDSLILV
jgi:hypothetical protein